MIDQLGAKAGQQLDHPDKMFDITREVLSMSDFVQAVSIGFQPSYYPQEGYWSITVSLRPAPILARNLGSR